MAKTEDYKDRKEVGVYSSVVIGVLSAIGGMAGVGAVIMGRSIVRYRPDMDGFWMACIPFVFPILTGIGVAYKRRLSSLGSHLGMLSSGFFAGGACFGYSVEPIFLAAANCTTTSNYVGLKGPDCDKPVLQIMYMVFGAIACCVSVLGLLLSSIVCSHARKRIKRDMEMANSESVLQKMMDDKRKRADVPTYHAPATSHEAENAKSNSINDDHYYTNKAYQNDTALTDSTPPPSTKLEEGTTNGHSTEVADESVTKL